MDACTIIAKNYLAYARVLARSYLEQHPHARFHVLFVDDLDGRIDPASEPFEVVTVADLEIEGFGQMAAMYDVLELSTAVKPWLLRWMLARDGAEGVLYLDPDMRLYAPLEDVFARVRDDGLVLSPHNLSAMPRDGERPTEQDILIAGVYNLGFIGLAAGAPAEELLDWWSERLRVDCIVDPASGLFVDQRWADFMPAMTERFHLLRDRGFNVAYWNLAARPVSRRDGGWWVAGETPLRLFHFSGFDPTRPHVLSKHQSRIRLGEHPDLADLCAAYADELLAAGARETAQWPYSLATTASGMRLNHVMRRLYRELALQGFDASPFDPEGEKAFLEQLTDPAVQGGRHGINRYLAALHEHRPDLQRAYPDLDDAADAAGYLGWAREIAKDEVPDPDVLAGGVPVRAPVADAAGPPPPATVPAPLGVNVVGYLRSELGVGEVARQSIEALDAAGVPVFPIGVSTPLTRQGHDFASAAPSIAPHPVNLVCVNADMLPGFAAQAGERFFAGRHTIGVWWWEVAAFPERFAGAFDVVDEVWAGSRFVADAISTVSPVPVRRMPTPVNPLRAVAQPRAALGLPEGFLFMFTYDFHSVFERKNPLGLVEAFVRAFPDPDDGASLALKSINAEHHPDEHERLRVLAGRYPHVHLLDYYVSAPDRSRLLQCADAYVSLHRSEGFGLTIAEAMHLGKPAIATGYSGNLDYMTEANSFLVDYELTPIGVNAGPYPPDALWAEPDLDHAADLMRLVFEDRETAAERGRQAAEDIRREHSAEVAGAAMALRLKEIAPRLPTVPVERHAADSALAHARRAKELVDAGSRPPGGRRLATLRRLPRRAALRLMRPHTVHQTSVNRAVSASLEATSASLRQVEELRHGSAGMLAELRALSRRIDALSGETSELAASHAALERAVRNGGSAGHPSGSDAGMRRYPPAPRQPWTIEYNDCHAAFVASELDDESLLRVFREDGSLPAEFAVGYDERVVEFPWVASLSLAGRVLDAGSTLNHAHVLQRVRRWMDDLHIVTLAPEEQAFPRLGVSYVYADLRDLPFKAATYDKVVSISTLEHVGMDNEYYGTKGGAAADPQAEATTAARELRRVLRPGGDFYLTVPVGRGERFSWVRTFTLDELDELVEAFGGERRKTSYFRYDGGWRSAEAGDVADARYRDHFSSPTVGADRLVAAEAVACLHLVAGRD